LQAVNRALEAMSYRGKDDHFGVYENKGWTMGHTRLAIQDLTEESSQPVLLDDNSLIGYVGEVFNKLPGMSELQTVVKTVTEQGPRAFHGFDGFWAVAAGLPDGTGFAFTDHLGIKPLYYWERAGIICSELTPMFKIEPPPAFDEVYLSNCIKFGYDYSGRTPFRGIRQLPPGHMVAVDEHGCMTIHQYWDWESIPRVTDLKGAVTQAVVNRLIGDREVALLLSGGLDSSIIYYTLKQLGVAVKSFSVENGESEFLPEGVTPLPMKNVPLEIVLDAMQAPLDLGSMVPQYQLGEALSEAGFNVCMSGDGADELFGGYRRAEEYDSQASDVFCELPYYHLPRLDRLMMRHTVELRSPFLAPSVVAHALSLPYAERIGKSCLKKAFADVVPQKILDRPKLPLKTRAVIEGGTGYRKHLAYLFTSRYRSTA
jgi:asparagine synthase (glutamine-hydrolysing)